MSIDLRKNVIDLGKKAKIELEKSLFQMLSLKLFWFWIYQSQ